MEQGCCSMRIPVIYLIFSSIWMVIFWVGGIGVPLGNLFSIAFHAGGWNFFEDTVLLSILTMTAGQAILSTLISAAGGFFLGLFLGEQVSEDPKSRVPMLLALPFGVPTLVVAMAWVAWLGRSGVLASWGIHFDWVYSLKAVVFAHAFLNVPWIALAVCQSRRHVPEEQLAAARLLGAGYFSELRFVVWPQVRWAFAEACAQVMSFCTTSFALVLILGGGPPVQTLETELYGRLRYGFLDLSGAAICAFWQLLITLFPWALILFFYDRNHRSLRPTISQKVRPQKEVKKRYRIGLVLIALGFTAPYGIVLKSQVLKIFIDSEQRSQVLSPFFLSLQLAGWSGLFSVFSAVMAVLFLRVGSNCFPAVSTFQAGLRVLFSLPSGLSSLVMGLAFFLSYGQWVDPFEGSFIAMVLLQTVLFFPVSFRVLSPVIRGLQIHQLEAAVSLGASGMKAFWWIEWPRWRGPLVGAFAGVAGASLGEIGAVSFFSSEKLIPLPLVVSRWMEHYRFEEAQGIAGLLFLLSMSLIFISFEVGNFSWERSIGLQ